MAMRNVKYLEATFFWGWVLLFLEATPSITQGLLLGLCSEIALGGLEGPYGQCYHSGPSWRQHFVGGLVWGTYLVLTGSLGSLPTLLRVYWEKTQPTKYSLYPFLTVRPAILSLLTFSS